jgi:hypothetical protein
MQWERREESRPRFSGAGRKRRRRRWGLRRLRPLSLVVGNAAFDLLDSSGPSVPLCRTECPYKADPELLRRRACRHRSREAQRQNRE